MIAKSGQRERLPGPLVINLVDHLSVAGPGIVGFMHPAAGFGAATRSVELESAGYTRDEREAVITGSDLITRRHVPSGRARERAS